MAGDWIPMRTNLTCDPAVIAVAAELGITEAHAVGLFHRLWSWASDHCENGHAAVTLDWINRHVGAEKFAESAVKNGWLKALESGGVVIPKFDKWLGRGAKKRLKQAERQRKKRHADVTHLSRNPSRSQRDKSVTTGQDRTEEKSKEEIPPNPPSGGKVVIPPELDTEAFRAAWGEWKDERRARKQKAYTARGESAQLKRLAAVGPAKAIEAIRLSIANTWQGIFPERNGANGYGIAGSDVRRRGRVSAEPGKYDHLGAAAGSVETPDSPGAAADGSAGSGSIFGGY